MLLPFLRATIATFRGVWEHASLPLVLSQDKCTSRYGGGWLCDSVPGKEIMLTDRPSGNFYKTRPQSVWIERGCPLHGRRQLIQRD